MILANIHQYEFSNITVLESARSEIIVGWCFLRKLEFDWRKL